MAAVIFGSFAGENAKKSPYLFGASEAAAAENMDFLTGKITPFAAPNFVKTAAVATRALVELEGGIHETPFVCESAIAARPAARASRTLITAATYKPMAAALDTSNALAIMPLSLPAPTAAPICSVSGNANAGTTPQSQIYAFSFVRVVDGAESPLSATAEVTASVGQSVSIAVPANLTPTLTGYPQVAGFAEAKMATTGAVQLAVYRSTGGAFLRLAAQNYTNAAATLTFAADAGGGVAAQFVGEETTARENLRGIGIHPKGFAYGFAGATICFSAVGQFGVWPRSYEIDISEGVIEAIAEFDGNLYVFPANTPPLLIRLDTPRAADKPVAAESNYPLASGAARAIVNMGNYGLWYPAQAGIVSLPGGQLITSASQSVRGNANGGAFAPPQVAWKQGDEYFGARADDVLYISMRSPAAQGAQTGSIKVAGVISAARDAGGGGVSVLQDGKIFNWAQGQKMEARWDSGKVRLTDKATLSEAWIVAGAQSQHTALQKEPTAWWPVVARAPSIGGVRYAGYAPLANKKETAAGRVTLKVHTETGEETITLPQDANVDDVVDADGMDCYISLANRDVTGWVRLEMITDREGLFMGVADNRAELVQMGQRAGVFPPVGLQA